MRDIKPAEDNYLLAEVGAKPKKEEKTRKVYPRLRLEHKYFPETKKWEVGKEYTVKLKLKMDGLSISQYQNDSDFEIIGFEVVEDEDK